MQIKSILKKKLGEDAVTDMVGTLLLLMIAIALFSIVYLAVFSFEPIDRAPSANIISYVNDKNISFEHWGGASLDLDETRVLFNIGGNEFEKITSDTRFSGDVNDNDLWDLGEILTYKYDDIEDIQGKNVDIKIIDLISNSLILSGNIQIGNRAPWIPSNPNPTNTSDEVNTIITLTWAGGDPNPSDTVTYDVYFEALDSTPIKVSSNQSEKSFDPGVLSLNTKYYWKIVAWDDDTYKSLSSSGPIWEFTTIVTPINNSPIISTPNVNDGETGVSINLNELSVLIRDPEGDLIDWTIECSSGDSSSGNFQINGTKTCSLTTPLEYTITYVWYVNSTDQDGSGNWTNRTYTFTTGDSGPPTFSNENPPNGQIGVSTALTELNISISDPEGDLINWTIETSPNIGSNSSTSDSNGLKTCSISGLTPLTTYTWFVNATDPSGSREWNNVTYVFTTQSPYIQFFDSFEDGEWNGLWVEDVGRNDWFDSTQRSTDGGYSAEVDGTNNSIDSKLTMANYIDLSSNNSATLTFSWYIENWGADEYISLDIYDGSDWILDVRQLRANIDPEQVWNDITVDLSSYLVNNFKIRFRATCDHKNDDGNIDNVKIETY